ncbi:glycosyltransferase family 4 protein [Marinomonas aquiplantarum]|uniref:Glycosyltransferase involved in cell wall biosynthesis n=1 Tax=Marinomonas aquiplantarum TaxID=491951 RepID=A0A366D6S4_9GAMM|nr:glycosyltransferase family 4 protein [Marinomonas aquiplantarum]RBO85737.1 glycosyltransferase involved in cell wall biosynthesis [Marinomonas aquiplantarum]
MDIKVLHILMTDYRIDSRVRNETYSLSNSGFDVTVLCMNGRDLPKSEIREGVKIKRFGISSIKIIQFISSYIGMFFYSLREKNSVVHAHDLTSLPIAFFISLFTMSKLVYDSHELWSESHHKKHPRVLIYLMEVFERCFGGRCDAVISVSDGISEYLQSYLKVPDVVTIRNIPSYTQRGNYDLFRSLLPISDDRKVFLYQGLISETRGVNVLFDAALKLSERNDVAFIFMGDGPFVSKMQDRLKEIKNKQSIFYLPPVSQDELLKYTISADVGIHAIRNTCKNHDLCLPNKIFEYISASLPVIVADLEEMSKLVNKYEIGLCFEDSNVDSLVECVKDLLNNSNKMNTLKFNVQELRKTLNWDNESKVLLDLYSRLHSV